MYLSDNVEHKKWMSMVHFRVPFVTLQSLSFSKSVALVVIPKSLESTRDTFESRFSLCYFFGAKKSGIQVKG